MDSFYVAGNRLVTGRQLWFVVIAMTGKAKRAGQQAFGELAGKRRVVRGAVWVSQAFGASDARASL